MRVLERLANKTTGHVSIFDLFCLDSLRDVFEPVKVLLLGILERLQLLVVSVSLYGALA